MKTPTPVQLPSKQWRCQVMVAGKRVSVTASTAKEAVAKALALKAGLTHAAKRPEALTVGEAIDRYIEIKDAVLSPATIAGYKRIRANALTGLMPVPLSALTREKVQREVNTMSKVSSPKTVRNAHGLLSATLEEFLPDMVLRTTLPQKKRYDAAIPSDADIEAILAAARGTAIEIPVLLAIWLGMRMSEVLGLTWERIEDDCIHIVQAKVDEGLKGTKTYSSQRTLPLPPYIKALLDAAPHSGDFVVTLSRRALYCRFTAMCKKAGIRHYRFHDLRHANASVMLALNIPDKYAMERMGHATNNMLKTVYQHTMDDKRTEVDHAVDNYFTGKLHTKLHTEKQHA